MLFGNLFGNKVRPRRFIYTPRYYDSEKDSDRSSRVKFDESPLRRSTRRRAGGSPWMLLAVAIVVVVLIFALQRAQKDQMPSDELELTPADAAPVETLPSDSLDASRP